jgi:tetratricopeptide (TPR) repeat protein
MARPLAKSPFVLLALGLLIFASSAASGKDDNLRVLNQRVYRLFEEGNYQEAIPIAERAVEVAKRDRGPEQVKTADALDNLGRLFTKIGEYAKAEPLYQEVLQIREKVLGPEHRDSTGSLNNLAELYEDMGEYAKAEPLLQEALRIRQKVLGPEDFDTATSLSNLAELYEDMGEYAKAEPLLQQALRIDQKVLGSEDLQTASSLNNLATLYQSMGEYAKAEPLYQEALRIRLKVLGSEHPDTAISISALALLKFDLGRIDEATVLARQASAAELKILSKILSFTSEQQRLAFLDIFDPYSLFPILKGTETDLAIAVLRYKGVVLDSIVKDRLLAEASQGSEDQKLVEQVNLGKRQLGQLVPSHAIRGSFLTVITTEVLGRNLDFHWF